MLLSHLQTPQQVPSSHTFPVDSKNFKCIFFWRGRGFKIQYFCAFAHYIMWIILHKVLTFCYRYCWPPQWRRLWWVRVYSCVLHTSPNEWSGLNQFLMPLVCRGYQSKHVDAADSGKAQPANKSVERLLGQPAKTQVRTIKSELESMFF